MKVSTISKNWAQTGNIQKLNQKYSPPRHWNVVHTVFHAKSRGFTFWVNTGNLLNFF
jgi:hypothetical protein